MRGKEKMKVWTKKVICVACKKSLRAAENMKMEGVVATGNVFR